MTPDQVFKIANTIVLIPWILMAILPRWSVTEKIVNSYVFPALLAFVYIFYIGMSIGKASGGFSTLDGVAKLFRNKNALLAGCCLGRQVDPSDQRRCDLRRLCG